MAALRSSLAFASRVMGTLSVPLSLRLSAWRLVEQIRRLLERDEPPKE